MSIDQLTYGHTVIPTKIDELTEHSPDHVFASIPRNSNIADGFRDISISDFARAVNRCAWWLESTLGRNSNFETIAYIGPADLRYFIVIVAAAKVGYKTLLASPRNSLDGQLSLFDSTKCSTLLTTDKTNVQSILAERPLRRVNVDSLSEWLSAKPVAQYPFKKTFEEAKNDPFIVLHTSGSTGLPKPMTIRHGWFTTMDMQHYIPDLDGQLLLWRALQNPNRLMNALPPFHAAGVGMSLGLALYYGPTVVWCPPDRPISSDVIEEMLDSVNLDLCFMPPSVLDEMSQSQSSLERLGKLKHVGFIGGPLGKYAGDVVSKYVHIINAVGSTEVLNLPQFLTEREDWIYFHYDPQLKGIEFRPIEDGFYEQVVVRHPSTDSFHGAWYTFPEKQEYKTNDLFFKHPSKSNMWIYQGRADDVLVLSNGEKLNPTAMEETIREDPDIREVIIVGQGKFEPAALIQTKNGTPPDSEDEMEEFVKRLHPYIVEANKKAPAHAKLAEDHITFVSPNKPMLLTAKGTVRRGATTRTYEAEINKLYSDIENASSKAVQIKVEDKASTIKLLQEILASISGAEELSPEEDIFSAGIDSLQTMTLVRQLRSSFTAYDVGILPDRVTPRIIYANPTVTKIAGALQNLRSSKEQTYESMEQERIKAMEDLLAKYSHNLPPKPDRKAEVEHELTIVLTGSTGSLGSYLLDSLLATPRVIKIFCLNRGAHAEKKQKEASASRGLTTNWGNKVQFIQTSIGRPKLGLTESDYESLSKKASFIIHNQWQVDFNLALDSFESHIAGTRELIDLSARSSKHPPIMFTSSIATLGNWSHKHKGYSVPEAPQPDFSVPASMGYAESKYVTERLLEKAGEVSGLRSSVCRIGQVGGPVIKGGMWNKQEWLPTIIASSKYLSKIPSDLAGQDAVNWIPVDTLSRILVDLLLSSLTSQTANPSTTQYLHLVNPHTCAWKTLVPSVMKHLGDPSIETVPFAQWVDALNDTSSRTEDVARNPGIKLLEFFEGMSVGGIEAELETKETVRGSETMRRLRAVSAGWMETWLEQWGF